MSDALKAEMIRLLPRLRAFARSLTGAADTADDLVQQTCEKALRNLAAFVPGTRMDAWLFRILRNAWIDGHRARRPTAQIEAVEAVTPLMGEDGRQVTEGRLYLDAVRRAMAGLSEEHRVVLMLVCVEGLRYREAALALGVPEGTVMSRLARARIALAEALETPAAATDRNPGRPAGKPTGKQEPRR